MATVNKVTTLRSPQQLTDSEIQVHIDVMNTDGWKLIGVDNLIGWYRFFWVKDEV